MNYARRILFILALFLFISSPAVAATYYVPDDFSTVQAALDAAANGDTIIVRDGVYTGEGNKNLDMKGKALTLRSENGPENCIVDIQGDNTNNDRGFYFHTGETSDSVVDGFSIINGYGFGEPRAGGGVCCSNSSPTIRNCRLTNNKGGYGGAIYCYQSSATIVSCAISENGAYYGSGIYCEYSSPRIINCSLNSNGWYVGGGIHSKDSTPTIQGCTVTDNLDEGIFLTGSNTTETIISDCIINGNHSGNFGGGIYNSVPAIIQNCVISLNSANLSGGGIYSSAPVTIINCVITENSGWYSGGGIYCSSSAAIKFCTLSDNSSQYGGGIYCEGASSAASVNSCILWDDHATIAGSELALVAGSTLSIDFSNVLGGANGASAEAGSVLNWGNGNIDSYPEFVDYPGHWDGSSWVGPDCHLTSDSPCIDAGADAGVSADIDGDARPQLAGYDMGSDEYVAVAGNHRPFLDSGTVDPSAGDTRTLFRFSVRYLDEDGDPPAIKNIILDGVAHAMNLLSGAPADGTYYSDHRLSAGEHSYSFSFYDGKGFTAKLPTEGAYATSGIVGVTRYVPDDYPTLQEALDDLLGGDTLIVRGGTYTGEMNKNLDFGGKAINLECENPGSCTIDCENQGRGFDFDSGETQDAVVNGFSIMNGNESFGGGIRCSHSSPTIRNCAIMGNRAWEMLADCPGGGIYCYNSSSLIEDCVISGNIANVGGGIFTGDSSVVIRNSLISSNKTVYEEEISGGGGISSFGGSLVLTNCSITGNDGYGGGIFASEGASLTISNSIIWGNFDPEVRVEENAGLNVTFSNIRGGYTGEGNIDGNPLFVSGQFGNFYLSQIAAGQASDSPCVDAGSDTAVNVGLDSYTTRKDQLPDAGTVDMGYHHPIGEFTELRQINLAYPLDEAYAFAPPLFLWSPKGGINAAFAVDISLWPDFTRYYSTYDDLHQPIFGASWKMQIPLNIWNQIPAGIVYWRVRGAEAGDDPLNVIYSDEVWKFHKVKP
jgi:hypothetical protein